MDPIFSELVSIGETLARKAPNPTPEKTNRILMNAPEHHWNRFWINLQFVIPLWFPYIYMMNANPL